MRKKNFSVVFASATSPRSGASPEASLEQFHNAAASPRPSEPVASPRPCDEEELGRRIERIIAEGRQVRIVPPVVKPFDGNDASVPSAEELLKQEIPTYESVLSAPDYAKKTQRRMSFLQAANSSQGGGVLAAELASNRGHDRVGGSLGSQSGGDDADNDSDDDDDDISRSAGKVIKEIGFLNLGASTSESRASAAGGVQAAIMKRRDGQLSAVGQNLGGPGAAPGAAPPQLKRRQSGNISNETVRFDISVLENFLAQYKEFESNEVREMDEWQLELLLSGQTFHADSVPQHGQEEADEHEDHDSVSEVLRMRSVRMGVLWQKKPSQTSFCGRNTGKDPNAELPPGSVLHAEQVVYPGDKKPIIPDRGGLSVSEAAKARDGMIGGYSGGSTANKIGKQATAAGSAPGSRHGSILDMSGLVPQRGEVGHPDGSGGPVHHPGVSTRSSTQSPGNGNGSGPVRKATIGEYVPKPWEESCRHKPLPVDSYFDAREYLKDHTLTSKELTSPRILGNLDKFLAQAVDFQPNNRYNEKLSGLKNGLHIKSSMGLQCNPLAPERSPCPYENRTRLNKRSRYLEDQYEHVGTRDFVGGADKSVGIGWGCATMGILDPKPPPEAIMPKSELKVTKSGIAEEKLIKQAFEQLTSSSDSDDAKGSSVRPMHGILGRLARRRSRASGGGVGMNIPAFLRVKPVTQDISLGGAEKQKHILTLEKELWIEEEKRAPEELRNIPPTSLLNALEKRHWSATTGDQKNFYKNVRRVAHIRRLEDRIGEGSQWGSVKHHEPDVGGSMFNLATTQFLSDEEKQERRDFYSLSEDDALPKSGDNPKINVLTPRNELPSHTGRGILTGGMLACPKQQGSKDRAVISNAPPNTTPFNDSATVVAGEVDVQQYLNNIQYNLFPCGDAPPLDNGAAFSADKAPAAGVGSGLSRAVTPVAEIDWANHIHDLWAKKESERAELERLAKQSKQLQVIMQELVSGEKAGGFVMDNDQARSSTDPAPSTQEAQKVRPFTADQMEEIQLQKDVLRLKQMQINAQVNDILSGSKESLMNTQKGISALLKERTEMITPLDELETFIKALVDQEAGQLDQDGPPQKAAIKGANMMNTAGSTQSGGAGTAAASADAGKKTAIVANKKLDTQVSRHAKFDADDEDEHDREVYRRTCAPKEFRMPDESPTIRWESLALSQSQADPDSEDHKKYRKTMMPNQAKQASAEQVAVGRKIQFAGGDEDSDRETEKAKQYRKTAIIGAALQKPPEDNVKFQVSDDEDDDAHKKYRKTMLPPQGINASDIIDDGHVQFDVEDDNENKKKMKYQKTAGPGTLTYHPSDDNHVDFDERGDNEDMKHAKYRKSCAPATLNYKASDHVGFQDEDDNEEKKHMKYKKTCGPGTLKYQPSDHVGFEVEEEDEDVKHAKYRKTCGPGTLKHEPSDHVGFKEEDTSKFGKTALQEGKDDEDKYEDDIEEEITEDAAPTAEEPAPKVLAKTETDAALEQSAADRLRERMENIQKSLDSATDASKEDASATEEKLSALDGFRDMRETQDAYFGVKVRSERSMEVLEREGNDADAEAAAEREAAADIEALKGRSCREPQAEARAEEGKADAKTKAEAEGSEGEASGDGGGEPSQDAVDKTGTTVPGDEKDEKTKTMVPGAEATQGPSWYRGMTQDDMIAAYADVLEGGDQGEFHSILFSSHDPHCNVAILDSREESKASAAGEAEKPAGGGKPRIFQRQATVKTMEAYYGNDPSKEYGEDELEILQEGGGNTNARDYHPPQPVKQEDDVVIAKVLNCIDSKKAEERWRREKYGERKLAEHHDDENHEEAIMGNLEQKMAEKRWKKEKFGEGQRVEADAGEDDLFGDDMGSIIKDMKSSFRKRVMSTEALEAAEAEKGLKALEEPVVKDAKAPEPAAQAPAAAEPTAPAAPVVEAPAATEPLAEGSAEAPGAVAETPRPAEWEEEKNEEAAAEKSSSTEQAAEEKMPESTKEETAPEKAEVTAPAVEKPAEGAPAAEKAQEPAAEKPAERAPEKAEEQKEALSTEEAQASVDAAEGNHENYAYSSSASESANQDSLMNVVKDSQGLSREDQAQYPDCSQDLGGSNLSDCPTLLNSCQQSLLLDIEKYASSGAEGGMHVGGEGFLSENDFELEGEHCESKSVKSDSSGGKAQGTAKKKGKAKAKSKKRPVSSSSSSSSSSVSSSTSSDTSSSLLSSLSSSDSSIEYSKTDQLILEATVTSVGSDAAAGTKDAPKPEPAKAEPRKDPEPAKDLSKDRAFVVQASKDPSKDSAGSIAAEIKKGDQLLPTDHNLVAEGKIRVSVNTEVVLSENKNAVPESQAISEAKDARPLGVLPTVQPPDEVQKGADARVSSKVAAIENAKDARPFNVLPPVTDADSGQQVHVDEKVRESIKLARDSRPLQVLPAVQVAGEAAPPEDMSVVSMSMNEAIESRPFAVLPVVADADAGTPRGNQSISLGNPNQSLSLGNGSPHQSIFLGNGSPHQSISLGSGSPRGSTSLVPPPVLLAANDAPKDFEPTKDSLCSGKDLGADGQDPAKMSFSLMPSMDASTTLRPPSALPALDEAPLSAGQQLSLKVNKIEDLSTEQSIQMGSYRSSKSLKGHLSPREAPLEHKKLDPLDHNPSILRATSDAGEKTPSRQPSMEFPSQPRRSSILKTSDSGMGQAMVKKSASIKINELEAVHEITQPEMEIFKPDERKSIPLADVGQTMTPEDCETLAAVELVMSQRDTNVKACLDADGACHSGWQADRAAKEQARNAQQARDARRQTREIMDTATAATAASIIAGGLPGEKNGRMIGWGQGAFQGGFGATLGSVSSTTSSTQNAGLPVVFQRGPPTIDEVTFETNVIDGFDGESAPALEMAITLNDCLVKSLTKSLDQIEDGNNGEQSDKSEDQDQASTSSFPLGTTVERTWVPQTVPTVPNQQTGGKRGSTGAPVDVQVLVEQAKATEQYGAYVQKRKCKDGKIKFETTTLHEVKIEDQSEKNLEELTIFPLLGEMLDDEIHVIDGSGYDDSNKDVATLLGSQDGHSAHSGDGHQHPDGHGIDKGSTADSLDTLARPDSGHGATKANLPSAEASRRMSASHDLRASVDSEAGGYFRGHNDHHGPGIHRYHDGHHEGTGSQQSDHHGQHHGAPSLSVVSEGLSQGAVRRLNTQDTSIDHEEAMLVEKIEEQTKACSNFIWNDRAYPRSILSVLKDSMPTIPQDENGRVIPDTEIFTVGDMLHLDLELGMQVHKILNYEYLYKELELLQQYTIIYKGYLTKILDNKFYIRVMDADIRPHSGNSQTTCTSNMSSGSLDGNGTDALNISGNSTGAVAGQQYYSQERKKMRKSAGNHSSPHGSLSGGQAKSPVGIGGAADKEPSPIASEEDMFRAPSAGGGRHRRSISTSISLAGSISDLKAGNKPPPPSVPRLDPYGIGSDEDSDPYEFLNELREELLKRFDQNFLLITKAGSHLKKILHVEDADGRSIDLGPAIFYHRAQIQADPATGGCHIRPRSNRSKVASRFFMGPFLPHCVLQFNNTQACILARGIDFWRADDADLARVFVLIESHLILGAWYLRIQWLKILRDNPALIVNAEEEEDPSAKLRKRSSKPSRAARYPDETFPNKSKNRQSRVLSDSTGTGGEMDHDEVEKDLLIVPRISSGPFLEKFQNQWSKLVSAVIGSIPELQGVEELHSDYRKVMKAFFLSSTHIEDIIVPSSEISREVKEDTDFEYDEETEELKFKKKNATSNAAKIRRILPRVWEKTRSTHLEKHKSKPGCAGTNIIKSRFKSRMAELMKESSRRSSFLPNLKGLKGPIRIPKVNTNVMGRTAPPASPRSKYLY